MSENRIKSIFMVEPDNQGWIIEKLMRDIKAECELKDINVSIGISNQYDGEDVIWNTRYLTAYYNRQAKINSLFITHVDDASKALQLSADAKNFDSIVCLSPQEARMTCNLLGRKKGIVGLNLPPRDLTVRPIRLAYMSHYYPDHRKREDWIVEYFTSYNPKAKHSFIFSFLGHSWEGFAKHLDKLDLNYEIVRYAFEMPSEYIQYKERLGLNDYLIYLGNDGGAMSVYDAVCTGIKVICTNGSYHDGLPKSVITFNDKTEFFTIYSF